MCRKTVSLIISLSLITGSCLAHAFQEPNGHWVGGYYSNWSYWRGRPSIKSLSKIESSAGAANFITYAFLGVTTSKTLQDNLPLYGGVVLTAKQQGQPGSVVDPEALTENNIKNCSRFPSDLSACATSKAGVYLEKYAHVDNHKTILMASIGGWSYTSRLSYFYKDYLNNHLVLKRFIHSTTNWLEGHPAYSGIDIDWETPGYGHSSISGREHSGEGLLYTKMIVKLRKALDKLGEENGKHYYLTVAVVVSVPKIKGEAKQGVQWKTIATNVDWFNLMGFDINGEFNAGNPESKARALAMSDPKALQSVIRYYISVGVPSKKIILGIPVYAREMLVAQKPIDANKYGYDASLHYMDYKGYFNAFKNEYYHYNRAYFDFQDNPNPDPYYPAGGMVDFTGVYDYQCFLHPIASGKATDNCNILKSRDNRGMVGQPTPKNLTLSYPKPGVAWLSGTQQDVKANFVNSLSVFYPAYPVFTLETQKTVTYKVKHLVKGDQLGGVWFWDLSQDALKSPKYSLFVQACKDLGQNGKCIPASPVPAGGVYKGKCPSGSSKCIELSNNSGHAKDHYTLTCNTNDKKYNFGFMQGECNDKTKCVKYVVLKRCTSFNINPSGFSSCEKIVLPKKNTITCDVNTLVCDCHVS